jgi:hypothetical protein
MARRGRGGRHDSSQFTYRAAVGWKLLQVEDGGLGWLQAH